VPFGCGTLLSGGGTFGTRYQQVYSSSDFPGTIDITGVTFFLTQFIPADPSSGFLNGGTYIVSLSTTSQPVNGLNLSDFDANVGVDHKVIFRVLCQRSCRSEDHSRSEEQAHLSTIR
jgi:hypothetical protein